MFPEKQDPLQKDAEYAEFRKRLSGLSRGLTRAHFQNANDQISYDHYEALKYYIVSKLGLLKRDVDSSISNCVDSISRLTNMPRILKWFMTSETHLEELHAMRLRLQELKEHIEALILFYE